MALQPMPDGRQTLPSVTDEPLSAALPVLLTRRRLTTGALAGLLRAEGIAISRTRLHQLSTGSGAPPTPEQLERLASVLGVSPAYFAEYRLWRVRALLDPGIVGFDRAMANFGRLRGGRGGGALDEGRPPRGSRYPPPVPSQSEERE
jgi:transcriptional regulator with XRE-family HTH domain